MTDNYANLSKVLKRFDSLECPSPERGGNLQKMANEDLENLTLTYLKTKLDDIDSMLEQMSRKYEMRGDHTEKELWDETLDKFRQFRNEERLEE